VGLSKVILGKTSGARQTTYHKSPLGFRELALTANHRRGNLCSLSDRVGWGQDSVREAEMQDVAVCDDVVLALQPHLSRFLAARLAL